MRQKPRLESIAHPLSESFSCLEFNESTFDCPYHYHPEYELTWIRSSYGKRMSGDSLEDFEPGDLVLHGKNLPHMYLNLDSSSRDLKKAQSQVIQWKENALGDRFFYLPENQRILRLLQKSQRGLAIQGKTARVVQKLIQKLFQSEEAEKIIVFIQILEKLALSPDLRTLSSLTYQNSFDLQKIAKINQILSYIHQHFNEEITLSQLAKRAHYTPTSFSRFFRQACKKSFIHYLNEIRLSHVRKQLIETDDSISEIAFACGYNNLSNFNTMFQRYFKMTPKFYRAHLLTRPSIPMGK